MLRPSDRVLFLGLFLFLLVYLLKPVLSGRFPYDGFLPEKSRGVFGAVACLESELNLKRVSGVRKDDISEVRAVELKNKPSGCGVEQNTAVLIR